MILKKPYAFFIKIFKPIHIVLALLITYLIFNTNRILSFFSQYIYSNESVVGQSLKEELVLKSLFIIPIVLIIFSLIFLGIMFNKRKPIAFYVINIFEFLVILVITIYISNFLGIMEQSIVSIKIVKLNHDLVLINMVLEVISFILLIIRGLGLNFKKFNFDSDITKFDIDEKDREEFELNINIDLDITKRNRKRKLRYLKYFYKENKLIINSLIVLFIISISTFLVYFSINSKDFKSEGVVYAMKKFSFKVNNTIILNENFAGEKITDNYLVVVSVELQSNLNSVSLFLKDFSLEAAEEILPVSTEYKESLIDIGVSYEESILKREFTNYIFTFEISEKYLNNDLYFIYNEEGVKTKIKLNPQSLSINELVVNKKLTEIMNFEESLGKIEFKINSFDIKDKFLIKYNYCVSDNDCVLSKEYIKASIDENFDKYVLKLDVEFFNNSNVDAVNFYEFFNDFGSIHYKKGETWYLQKSKFEELKSKKVDNKNNVYMGINSNILNSDSIKLVFNIRGSKYQYLLK